MKLERISQSAIYRWLGGDVWVVGVKVSGTAGNLERFGIAFTDNNGRFWEFEETDKKRALEVGQ